ncbi:hypothetical protein ACHQM5_003547 [Ranunculus cassubicifolius]
MSSKKDEKALAAAERIKGMSRVQSEKAAASATRNVNAYGQKEEGPSRWQEKKELKRQMYEQSTEKQVRLGERKGVKNSADTSDRALQCQKCFGHGHWSFECKNERAYVSRPSQTKQIKNPKLRMKLSVSYDGNPDILPPEEKKDEKVSKKSNSKHHRRSDSREDTGSDSSLATGSDSSSGERSSSSSSSESEGERRRRKRSSQKKRKHPKYSSSSESSDSYSDSESYSESDSGSDKKKSRRHHKKH